MNNFFEAYTDGSCDNMNIYKAGGSAYVVLSDGIPIKEGSKGPIVCDFAFLRITEARNNLPGPEVWLILRRNLDDPSVVKFYFSNAPAKTSVIEFVRISGAGIKESHVHDVTITKEAPNYRMG